MSSSSGSVTGSKSVDGSKVTIIGDSITVGATSQLEQQLPGVDIRAQVSKQFYNGTSDNPGGIQILRDLVDNGTLRETLVLCVGDEREFYARPGTGSGGFGWFITEGNFS